MAETPKMLTTAANLLLFHSPWGPSAWKVDAFPFI